MKQHSLGIGILNWDGRERRTDRYGTVTLSESTCEGKKTSFVTTLNIDGIKTLAGKKGTLIARVIEARESRHIGDLFRGFHQTRIPKVDEPFVLGVGKLFYEKCSFAPLQLGVLPEDKREQDWLDPQVLYVVHDQTVELIFNENENV
jgi:hypothetical protein